MCLQYTYFSAKNIQDTFSSVTHSWCWFVIVTSNDDETQESFLVFKLLLEHTLSSGFSLEVINGILLR